MGYCLIDACCRSEAITEGSVDRWQVVEAQRLDVESATRYLHRHWQRVLTT